MRGFWLGLWLGTAAWAQGSVALTNATIHPCDGSPPRQAHLVLQGERILAISDQIPPQAQVVDLAGLHLYPGMVESDSQLGLVEIESVRGSLDVGEVGDNNADLRPELAFNPDSELIPVARSGGILTVALLPSGGRIAGRIAALQLSEGVPEQKAGVPGGGAQPPLDQKAGVPGGGLQLSTPPALLLEWPQWSEEGSLSQAKLWWQQQLDQLKDWLAEARAWSQLPQAAMEPRARPDLDALAQVLKQGRLFIRAQSRFEIESALRFCRDQNLDWVLVGGAEAGALAQALAQAKVDVIYTEMYRLPEADYLDYDCYYRVPAQLSAAGVRVALAGPHSHDNARWLPQLAAAAWAHGWTCAQAEASITRVPCQILGLSDQGQLRPGQRATLLACDGPLLEGRTRVLRAWCSGREVSLDDRQKRLYQKYRKPDLRERL